jgi:hypothetical protein
MHVVVQRLERLVDENTERQHMCPHNYKFSPLEEDLDESALRKYCSNNDQTSDIVLLGLGGGVEAFIAMIKRDSWKVFKSPKVRH